MMRTMIRVGVAVAMSLMGAAASAQEVDWYAGVGVGAELSDRGPSYGVDPDADTLKTLLVGARFAQGFGVEASYVDLGRLFQAGIADGGFDVDGELWSVGATYTVSFDAFEPYAKLGWFSREEDGVSNSIAGPVPISFDDDGVMGEVGARWRINEPVALRLGYVWYDFEPESDGSVQVAAEWHF